MWKEIELEGWNIPLYGDTIEIPENTIFYRGYDINYPTISDRPAYYGSLRTAAGYARNVEKTEKLWVNSVFFLILCIKFLTHKYSLEPL